MQTVNMLVTVLHTSPERPELTILSMALPPIDRTELTIIPIDMGELILSQRQYTLE